jgi:hypothetical protein
MPSSAATNKAKIPTPTTSNSWVGAFFWRRERGVVLHPQVLDASANNLVFILLETLLLVAAVIEVISSAEPTSSWVDVGNEIDWVVVDAGTGLIVGSEDNSADRTGTSAEHWVLPKNDVGCRKTTKALAAVALSSAIHSIICVSRRRSNVVIMCGKWRRTDIERNL